MDNQPQSTQNQDPETNRAQMSSEDAAKMEKVDQILKRRQQSFLEEERDLLVWKAPARVFKTRSKEFYTTIGSVVILVSIVLIFLREILLMFAVISFAFMAYVLATVKPDEIEHRITSRGVRTNGKFYRWDVLGRYWIESKDQHQVLIIETFSSFPRMLYLIVPEDKIQQVKELLTPYILYEKPEPDFVDKASDWLSRNIPLESS